MGEIGEAWRSWSEQHEGMVSVRKQSVGNTKKGEVVVPILTKPRIVCSAAAAKTP